MAERKSGPVKPPVIDLTARPAGAAKAAAAAKGDAAPKAGKPADAAKPAEVAKPAQAADSAAAFAASPPAPGKVHGPVVTPATPVAPLAAAPAAATPVGPTPALAPVSAASETASPDTGAAKPEAPKPAPAGSGAPPKLPEAAPAATKPASAEKPTAPRPAAAAPDNAARSANNPWPGIATGAIGGAVIATAVCYSLAFAGLWPAPATDTDTRLAQLESRLGQTEKSSAANVTALADVNTRLGGLETDFAAKLAATSDTLGQLQQVLAKLQAAKPATDLAPLEAELKTLSARVDAVAAGASSADAGALAANMSTVQQNLADLTGKLATLDTRASQGDAAMTSLKAELDSAKAAIDQAARAPSPKTIASAMQLPLLISALDADFAAGRPYAADLATLTAAVPETHVPASVTQAAAAGLPAPDELARRFEDAVPDMMGARPAGSNPGWQGQMTDWLKQVLAVRQQGEQTGDSPDAVLSRLEAAVNRHDFAAAGTLFDQLPAPMQKAAADLGGQIHALADADAFVAGLRATALAPAAGVQQ